MSLQRSNRGFSAVEGFLIAIILVIIGVVGYKVYNTKNNTDQINSNTTSASQQGTTASDLSSVPTISSTADLDKALKFLDQTDPASDNNSDASSLDSQLSTF